MKNEEIQAIKAVLEGIPTEGIIELKALYFKDARVRLEPTKSRLTGKLMGVPNLSDEDKKQLTFYTEPTSFLWIKDGFKFDLSKYEDRLLWAMAKQSHLIGETFELAQNTPGARFYISNEEEQLHKELQEEAKQFKALNFIYNDKPDELIARARLLGVDMTGEGADFAKKLLLKTVREHGGVDKVLGLYNSNVISTTILFYKACDKQVIKSKNGVFMYGTMPLGSDEDSVITFLQSPNNTHMVDQIKYELNPELFGKATPGSADDKREK